MSEIFIGTILIILTIILIILILYKDLDTQALLLGAITGFLGFFFLVEGIHDASIRNFSVIQPPTEYVTTISKDNSLYKRNEEYEIILRDGEFNQYRITMNKYDYEYYFEDGKIKMSIENLKKVVNEFEEIK